MDPFGQAKEGKRHPVAAVDDGRVAVAHVDGREIAVFSDGTATRVVERSRGAAFVLWEGDQAGALARWEDRVHDLVRQCTQMAPPSRYATV